MDVLLFLTTRTKFIRYFYETAGAPFREIIRKIDANEEPFYSPPYIDSENSEPAFLVEWMEAGEGLNVLGRACISMLSASLQLNFKTWEHELGVTWEEEKCKKSSKNGFFQGYMTLFGEVLDLSWDDCPADRCLLEQVVLARHRDQHPDVISTMGVRHTTNDQQKFPQLFFVSEIDKILSADIGKNSTPVCCSIDGLCRNRRGRHPSRMAGRTRACKAQAGRSRSSPIQSGYEAIDHPERGQAEEHGEGLAQELGPDGMGDARAPGSRQHRRRHDERKADQVNVAEAAGR